VAAVELVEGAKVTFADSVQQLPIQARAAVI
jgi:hypothetical protein